MRKSIRRVRRLKQQKNLRTLRNLRIKLQFKSVESVQAMDRS
jgi:hypothetical protein